MIKVLLFAGLKEAVGHDEIDLTDVPENIGVLKTQLGEKYHELVNLLPNAMVAINEEYADEETTIHAGDTVALIPPVSGG